MSDIDSDIFRIQELPDDFVPEMTNSMRVYLRNELITDMQAKIAHVHDVTNPMQSQAEEIYLVARIRIFKQLLSLGE